MEEPQKDLKRRTRHAASERARAHRDRLKIEPNERPEAVEGRPTPIGYAQHKENRLKRELTKKLEARGADRSRAEATAERLAEAGRRRPARRGRSEALDYSL